jgi:hypothetical protein
MWCSSLASGIRHVHLVGDTIRLAQALTSCCALSLSLGAVSSPIDTGAGKEAEGGEEKQDNGTQSLSPEYFNYISKRAYITGTPKGLQFIETQADRWVCVVVWQRG